MFLSKSCVLGFVFFDLFFMFFHWDDFWIIVTEVFIRTCSVNIWFFEDISMHSLRQFCWLLHLRLKSLQWKVKFNIFRGETNILLLLDILKYFLFRRFSLVKFVATSPPHLTLHKHNFLWSSKTFAAQLHQDRTVIGNSCLCLKSS